MRPAGSVTLAAPRQPRPKKRPSRGCASRRGLRRRPTWSGDMVPGPVSGRPRQPAGCGYRPVQDPEPRPSPTGPGHERVRPGRIASTPAAKSTDQLLRDASGDSGHVSAPRIADVGEPVADYRTGAQSPHKGACGWLFLLRRLFENICSGMTASPGTVWVAMTLVRESWQDLRMTSRRSSTCAH
jgi:hypothetical protein